MTETEWLACEHPDALLGAPADSVTERRVRLFGCACSHRIWAILPEESRTALEVAERYAEGLATRAELERSFQQAEGVAFTQGRPWQLDALTYATAAAAEAIFPRAAIAGTAVSAAEVASSAAGCAAGEAAPDGEYDVTCERTCKQELAEQMKLMRDVFGNPFRPVALDPLWLTFDVQTLARGIYEERAFDRMPILADALQDAGCNNDEVLAHCRDPKQVHVRGCWVLDLLLGKV